MIELRLSREIVLLLPDPKSKTESDQDRERSEHPSCPPLQMCGSLLRRRDLGEPLLLACERRLLALALGGLARSASFKVGDAFLAQTLAKILARRDPLGCG